MTDTTHKRPEFEVPTEIQDLLDWQTNWPRQADEGGKAYSNALRGVPWAVVTAVEEGIGRRVDAEGLFLFALGAQVGAARERGEDIDEGTAARIVDGAREYVDSLGFPSVTV